MYDYFFMQLLHHIPRDKQTYTINDDSFLIDAAVSTHLLVKVATKKFLIERMIVLLDDACRFVHFRRHWRYSCAMTIDEMIMYVT